MTSGNVALIDAEHPWPGLLPFTEESRAFFHGRDAEAGELVRLIEREPLTVLFGQSGLGKSSLLNAGVFPRLRRAGYLPIYLRLNLDDAAPLPIMQVWQALKDESARHDVTMTAPREGDSFWKYLHRPETQLRNPHGRPITAVLAFDQFEEIFTLGRQTAEQVARCQAFLRELGELIENRMPPSLEVELTGHPERLDEFDLLRHSLKIVFTFREDYLADFEGLKSLIRPVMQNRMRLAPMDGARAAVAIQQAGNGRVSEAVAARIVRFVGGAGRDDSVALDTLQVEPALLSLVCRELNEQRIKRREREINADLIKGDNAQNIIEQFYAQGFAKLDKAVRMFVEDRLLTAAGFRDSCALDNALAEPGISEVALQTLVARRILRREERGGLVRLELIHDVLAGVAKTSRDKRRAEAALAEARNQLARQRQRQRWIAAGAAVLLTLVVGVSWLAVQASHARDEALAAKIASDEAKERANQQRGRAENESRRALSAEADALRQKSTAEQALQRAQSAETQAWEQKLTAEAAKSEGDHNLGLVLAEKADRAFAERRVNAGQVYASRALSRLDGARAPELRVSLRGDRLVNPGVAVTTLGTHAGEIHSVRYSPDGRFLATGSGDGKVMVWSVANNDVIATISAGRAVVHAIAFSPDARTLAFGTGDGTLGLADAASGKVIASFSARKSEFISRADALLSVAFSPDGQTLAAGTGDGAALLWNIAGGKVSATLQHFDEVLAVAFSPDGLSLATGSADKVVRVWDVASGKLVATLRGRSGEVNSVAFSPNGRILAAASADYAIRFWDVESGKAMASYTGHQGPVLSIAFSQDGQNLVSASKDGTVRMWDVEAGKVVLTLGGHKGAVNAVAIHPEGRTIASGSADKSVRVWELPNGRAVASMHAHVAPVHGVAFAPDGRLLATGSADHAVRLWSTGGGKSSATLEGHKGPVLSIALARDGRTLASGSGDQTVRLWDVATGKTLATFSGHTHTVNSVALSADGRTLASGSADSSVRLWDVASGKQLAMLAAHEGDVTSIAFSPDGLTLASASADHTIRLWSVAGQKVLGVLVGHAAEVRSVAFSVDGRLLASGSADGTVRLWNVTTGKVVSSLAGHKSEVCSVAFSPDGTTLASSSVSGSIRLWNAATGSPIATFAGHKAPACSLAFSPTGGSLASASDDRTARVWPLSQAELTTTDWRAQAARDEAHYGLKFEGASVVPR